MLLDNDVMADGKPQPGSFAGWLGREEWIEHLVLHVRRNAGAIVPDRYFDPVPEILGGGSQDCFAAVIYFRATF